jgi:hypothetical protein
MIGDTGQAALDADVHRQIDGVLPRYIANPDGTGGGFADRIADRRDKGAAAGIDRGAFQEIRRTRRFEASANRDSWLNS